MPFTPTSEELLSQLPDFKSDPCEAPSTLLATVLRRSRRSDRREGGRSIGSSSKLRATGGAATKIGSTKYSEETDGKQQPQLGSTMGKVREEFQDGMVKKLLTIHNLSSIYARSIYTIGSPLKLPPCSFPNSPLPPRPPLRPAATETGVQL